MPAIVVAFAAPPSVTVAPFPPAPLIVPEIMNVAVEVQKFTPLTFPPLTFTVACPGVNEPLGVTV